MAITKDFRLYGFSVGRVDSSGRSVAKAYWKLYAIENLTRTIAHTILTAQLGMQWWDTAVPPPIQREVARRKATYSKTPQHTSPGSHDLYYTLLSELNRIVAANSHLFAPMIGDIHKWIAELELIRVPRNIVGHMNWPHAADRRRIDGLHADLQRLVRDMTDAGTTFAVP